MITGVYPSEIEKSLFSSNSDYIDDLALVSGLFRYLV
jgi:hypothetical protein